MLATLDETERRIEEFSENGFVVIPNALTAGQVSALHQAINHDQKCFPEAWFRLNDTLHETMDILLRTADFDFTIENPATLGFLRKLLGENISFEEFEVMIREPTGKPRDFKGWHRDLIREFDRRMEIGYISVIYYLTDVTAADHCFSIIPKTHHSLVDLRPEEVQPGAEHDVLGPAGTAVIFHGRCIHSGKLKAESRQRRTLHVYYWTADQPRASEWTEIPRRLYERVEPGLPPRLYSKWNLAEVVEGVGKKPKDLDPSMPVAEMIREVQRRANPVQS